MAFVLYAATAAALLWLAHRFVMPISRASALILFLLPLCFTGRALLTGGVYGPVDLPYLTEPLREMRVPLGVPVWHNGLLSDLYAQMIPWRKAVQFALAHHQWPLWNPFILSGSLLAATAQPAVYSPFTLLACLLPIGAGLTYSAATTLFIAALGAFLFASDLELRAEAAWFAGAAWMCATPLAFFVLWSVGSSWAFLPLVLLGTRRCVRQPSIASAALLMIALTLLLFAGHPETVLHAVFIGGLYGLFELTRVRRGVVAAIGLATAAGAIALLIAAIYLLPILDAAPQSGEYQFRRQVWSHQPHGVSPQQSIARLLTDFFPFLGGQHWNFESEHDVPLDSTAAGSVVMALAVYAAIRAQRAEKWFFLAISVFGLLARAAWAPLANTIQHLPLFDMTITERFSFAGACALAILAAMGVDELLRRGRDRVATTVLFVALIAFTAGTLWLRRSGIVTLRSFPDFGHYAESADLIGIGLAAIIAMWRPAYLLPVLLLQRILGVGDVYPTLPSAFAYPPIPILDPLKKIREPFRIVGHRQAMIPGTSALYELEDVRGYEALTLDRYIMTYSLWCVPQTVWFNRVDDLTRPFLSLLNVRYAITTSDPPPGWHTVAKQRGSQLIENERVLPRAFIPALATVGRREGVDTTFIDMQQQADFRERAWIDAPMPVHDEQNGPGVVSAIEKRPNGFRIRVTMKSAGRVVVSEPTWKGWRAYIDGRRVQMQIADLAFLAIYVPAGSHTIRLVYLPDAFVVGRAITFTTLIALLLAAVLQRFKFLLQRRDRGVAALPLRE
jgi:hypothetical protein